MAKEYHPIHPGRKRFKTWIVRFMFLLMGRAFQAAARFDPDIKKEVASWPEGYRIMMHVMPQGPCVGYEKKDGKALNRGSKLDKADLVIHLKNIECAILLVTAQQGVPQAYAENRMSVVGDIAVTMSFTRCFNMVGRYLFPVFICRRIMKRVPALSLKKQAIRIYILLVGLPLGI